MRQADRGTDQYDLLVSVLIEFLENNEALRHLTASKLTTPRVQICTFCSRHGEGGRETRVADVLAGGQKRRCLPQLGERG